MEARDECRLLNLQRQLARLKLIIIDELGFVPMSTTGTEKLFEVFSQLCERGSILVTTNLPFDEWTEVLDRRASRRAAGPPHPPRPYPGDERRQLPPKAQPAERRVPSLGRRIGRPEKRPDSANRLPSQLSG